MWLLNWIHNQIQGSRDTTGERGNGLLLGAWFLSCITIKGPGKDTLISLNLSSFTYKRILAIPAHSTMGTIGERVST